MYILSYKIHDYDGGEFEPLFVSKDKSVIEQKRKELFDHHLGLQQAYYKERKFLNKKFPVVNDDNREKYAEAYKKIPTCPCYYLHDPESKRVTSGPCGDFVIDEAKEI